MEKTMAANEASAIAKLVGEHEQDILPAWLGQQIKAGVLETGRIKEPELGAECRKFLGLLREGLAGGSANVSDVAFGALREFLTETSHARALQGFSPTETAIFIFSLKRP